MSEIDPISTGIDDLAFTDRVRGALRESREYSHLIRPSINTGEVTTEDAAQVLTQIYERWGVFTEEGLEAMKEIRRIRREVAELKFSQQMNTIYRNPWSYIANPGEVLRLAQFQVNNRLRNRARTTYACLSSLLRRHE